VRAERAAELLSGTELSDADIRDAAEAAMQVVDPPSDVRASAEYRRHLVPVYVEKVLTGLRAAATDEREQR
jgi:carbon-monoxide dehydrogenase medium subunit